MIVAFTTEVSGEPGAGHAISSSRSNVSFISRTSSREIPKFDAVPRKARVALTT
jgi:hypothetical protein